MTRVLVIDDDTQLCAALTSALLPLGHMVDVAYDARSGLKRVRSSRPDVVVVDLVLPDLDGVEVVARIRRGSQVPILMLTASVEADAQIRAFRAGADDYLRKPFSVEALSARLHALARRPQLRPDEKVIHAGAAQIDLARRVLTIDGAEVRLTPLEWRLLGALAGNPNRLMRHLELIHAAWDDRHGEESRDALRVHMRSLRAKLGDDARAPRYIRTESGIGFRWVAATAEGDQSGADVPVRTGRAVKHDLDNAVTALRMIAFVLGPDGEGVGDEARADAAERLTRAAVRIHELTDELVHVEEGTA